MTLWYFFKCWLWLQVPQAAVVQPIAAPLPVAGQPIPAPLPVKPIIVQGRDEPPPQDDNAEKFRYYIILMLLIIFICEWKYDDIIGL